VTVKINGAITKTRAMMSVIVNIRV